MLAFLLFAGALHVDLSLLRSRASVVGAMATFGVLISTVVVGLGFWLIARLVGVDISLIWAHGLRRADQPDRSGGGAVDT